MEISQNLCPFCAYMFEYTVEGCKKAIEWLTENNLNHLIERELSTDGWTIVALANLLKKRKDESNNQIL